MEFDPIWAVAVIGRWRPCGYALMKDLRRWIVTRYLCDLLTWYQCWRALHPSQTYITYPHANALWRILHGKSVRVRDISQHHLPVLARPGIRDEYPGALMHACDLANAQGYTTYDAKVNVAYEAIKWSCTAIAHKYAVTDYYIPTEQERMWIDRRAGRLRMIGGYGKWFSSPWMLEPGSHTRDNLDRTHENDALYKLAIKFMESDAHEKGKLLIEELVTHTNLRRIYMRSGVQITVSVWDVMRVPYDDIIVDLYVAGVTFTI